MQRWLKERGEQYKLRDSWEICNGDYNGWQKHVKESKNRKAETYSKSPMNKLHSESTWHKSNLFKSNKVSLDTQLTKSAT